MEYKPVRPERPQKEKREKPLAAIWYRVLGLMRREAILSTEASASLITHE